MKRFPLVNRLLTIIFLVTLLVPNYSVVYSNSVQEDSNSKNLNENELWNEIKKSDKIPDDLTAVVKSVYDPNATKKIEKVKSLTIKRQKQHKNKTQYRLDDLSKSEIEILAKSGASIEDIYWINLFIKDTDSKPLEIFEYKKESGLSWENLDLKIFSNNADIQSVEKEVYQNTSFTIGLNNINVNDSVYKQENSIEKPGLLMMSEVSFEATVNSVFNGLYNLEQINQTKKQQYSDHNHTSEIIDPASGALTWKENEISLPGRDGLNLDIGIMYNSNQSYGYQRNDAIYGSLQKYNYLATRYDLGLGWSFQFPSVEINDGYMFYHDSQGQVYRVDFNASDPLASYTHLIGYQGKDIQFMQDASYSNGQALSAYYLEYADKKREYFAEDGRLLGIVDRYGNTINFEHTDRQLYDGKIYKVISKITDSVKRTVNFTYESTLNDASFLGEKIELTVKDPSGSDAQKISFLKMRIDIVHNGTNDRYLPYLYRITNQNGEHTYLNHYIAPTRYDFNSKIKNENSGYNFDAILTEVEYPTRTKTYYGLRPTTRNLGPNGFSEEQVVAVRKDIFKGTEGTPDEDEYSILNKVDYSYVGDYTGYPTFNDSSNIPESYTFSSKSVLQSNTPTNEMSKNYLFNGSQQNLSISEQASNGERSEIRNFAFDSIYKYLPTKVIDADYAAGDTDITPSMLYTDISYNEWGTIQSITQPITLSEMTNPITKNLYTTSFTYEPNYHLLKTTKWYQNASTSATESYEYNESGRITKFTNANNETTNFSYEFVPADTRKIKKVVKEKKIGNDLVSSNITTYGIETDYAYPTEVTDTFTNVSSSNQKYPSSTKKIFSYFMGTGALKDEVDASDNKIGYTYDLLGRITSVTFPTITNDNGEKYDVVDLYSYTLGGNGNVDGSLLEILTLRVNSKRKYTQKSNGVTTYLSNQNQYYDGLGNLRLEEKVDTSAKTVYFYDDLSRVKLVVDPLGKHTSVKYNSWGELNEITDGFGNLYIEESNHKLRKTTKYIVPTDRVTAYRNNTSDTTTKSMYLEETYDQWGHLISNRFFKDFPSQLNIISEYYKYDFAGNLISYTDPNNNLNSDGVSTKYSYDALNHLTSVKNANDETTKYYYDSNGNIINTTMQSNTNTVSVSLGSKEYNELGLTYKKKDSSSASEFSSYNQLGLIEQKIDRNGTITNYLYNKANQKISDLLTSSNGSTQQYKKNIGSNGIKKTTHQMLVNGVVNSTQTTTIDSLNRLTSLISSATNYSSSTDFKYDIADHVSTIYSVLNSNYFYNNYAYNFDRLYKVQTNGSNTENYSNIESATYDYFSTGELRSITYPTLSDGTILKSEYTYDKLKRISTLQNLKGSSILSSYSYTYDKNGNITSITENRVNEVNRTINYTYDKLNRLKSITRPDGGGDTFYSYDLQGNRTEVKDESQNLSTYIDTSFSYDLNNNLIGVKNGAIITSINYLPTGMRYQKTKGTLITQYNYNQKGEIISEYRSDGQRANYVRADRLLVKKDVTAAKDYYYLYNGHGDVVQILDTNGNIVNSYAYDAWGNITTQKEGITNPFKYAGEVFDEETGLYYLRARYYDPSMGRFLNEDTYEGQINNPLSLNLYTYVINNPLKYTDPTGNMHEMGGKGGPSGGGGAYTVPKWLLTGSNKVKVQSTTVRPKTVKTSMDSSNSSDKLKTEVNSQRNSTKGTGEIQGMPPIVQSRINISKDGFKHVVEEHYSTKNKSQFTISQDKLRSLLSDKNVVSTPVTRTIDSADGIRYVREVTLDKPIGTDKFNSFNPTSTMTILTDSHGNLITVSPGIIK